MNLANVLQILIHLPPGSKTSPGQLTGDTGNTIPTVLPPCRQLSVRNYGDYRSPDQRIFLMLSHNNLTSYEKIVLFENEITFHYTLKSKFCKFFIRNFKKTFYKTFHTSKYHRIAKNYLSCLFKMAYNCNNCKYRFMYYY